MDRERERERKNTVVPDIKTTIIPALADAGLSFTPLDGKAAYLKGWTKTPWDPLATADDLPGNYGIVWTKEFLVLDVDAYKFPEGRNSLAEFMRACGLPGWFETHKTFIVLSGGGGGAMHIVLRKPPGWRIKGQLYLDTKDESGKSIERFPGLEFKSQGHQTAGPGSIHPKTGNVYTVAQGWPDQIAYAPYEMLEILKRPEPPKMADMNWMDDDFTRDKFIDLLENRFRPAVEGHDGEPLTLATAMAGKDLALPPETTFRLMADHWNDRCSPPWNLHTLEEKVEHAYQYGSEPIGCKHPSAGMKPYVRAPEEEDFEEKWLDKETRAKEEAKRRKKRAVDREASRVEAGLHWFMKYKGVEPDIDGAGVQRLDKDGNPKFRPKIVGYQEMMNNLITWWSIPDKGEFKNEFLGAIKRNLFTHNIDFIRPMPWHTKKPYRKFWTGDDTKAFIGWMGLESGGWEPSEKTVNLALGAFADKHQYHPVKDYFNSLEWDGVRRVDTLFSYYVGAEDTLYTRAVSKTLMIAMAARILLERHEPPYNVRDERAKHDHVVVLEGPQGLEKSSFCQSLGGEWTMAVNLDTRKEKETIELIQGQLIVELAELSGRTRQDSDALKFFITKAVDKMRIPYQTTPEFFPRQSVMIATLNWDRSTVGYLYDQTGNRRFLPITVRRILTKELERDRDQLFAEAVHRYRMGEAWHLADQDVIDAATAQQNLRLEVDAWADTIRSAIESLEETKGEPVGRLSRDYIASHILGISSKEMNRTIQTRISNSMKAIGWVRAKINDGKKREIGYKRSETMEPEV